LRTAACFQIVKDGAAVWGNSRESENLRLSSPQIPDRELRRDGDFGFETYAREGKHLRNRALTPWFRSNLADDNIRHDELIRELTQEGDASDFAKQNER
jgi:hypothetical protein